VRLHGGLARTHTLIRLKALHMRKTMGDEGYSFKKPHTEADVEQVYALMRVVFPQLLLGYRCREELEYAYPDVRVAPSHRMLVDALFPKRPSYIHHVY